MEIRKRLLILGASETQLPIILRAKELGYFTIVADYNANAPAFEYADKKLIISTIDTPSLLKVARDYMIDGVLTTSDYPVRSVAHICKSLGLSGPSVNAATLCTDKFLLREHLSQNNFLVPRYKIIKSRESLFEIDYFPCVIKPVDSSGSRGVQRVNNIDELINAYEISLVHSKSATVIVEEFISGEEFSVETLTQKGNTTIVAITGKTVQGEKESYFVESRHVIPAEIPPDKIELISGTVLKVIKTLNLGNSPTHTELKINYKGVYIIEIGARLGGDYITSDLVPLATGVDMLENAINLALNIKIETLITLNKYSGIQFITSENHKQIVDFLKIDNPIIKSYKIEQYKDLKLKNSFDRLGHFIVQANSREQLNRTLNCK